MSIASGTNADRAGIIDITDEGGVNPQIVVNDSATIKVDNGGKDYAIDNVNDELTLTGIKDGAILQATSAIKILANATNFTINDAEITIKSNEQYSGSALVTLKESGEIESIVDQKSDLALSYIVGDSYDSDYDIFNSKDSLPVNGSNNPEIIFNSGNFVTINALGGNDTLIIDRYAYPSSGSHISIDAGNGHDQIAVDCSNSTITGGAGNDSIRSYGANVSISGGAGKDTIQTQDQWYETQVKSARAQKKAPPEI